jgi:hypothetical protein
MNQGRPVFAQLLDFLPRRAFEKAVERYGGSRRVRTLSCMDQLLCMAFAQLTGRSSLRETVACLNAVGSRRYHCGMRGRIRRSTLADANEKRDYRIFMDTAMAMIAAAKVDLPVDRRLAALKIEAYALDSTTIDLCLKLFPWAAFRRRKGGIKAHTLYDLRFEIPVFLRVTSAKTADVTALDWITPTAGAYYVFDLGYVDFARFWRLHNARAFFVTRAKRNLDFIVRRRLPADRAAGIINDRLIRLRGPKSKTLYPDTLRLIRYVDPDDGKRLRFVTNNLTLPAATIALLYRKRWRIELFFKWIKQHLHIKAFYGTTPNAVKLQLWTAVIVYVLIVRSKHHYGLPHQTNEIMQILSVTIFEKTPVFELFSEINACPDGRDNHNQLMLFDL